MKICIKYANDSFLFHIFNSFKEQEQEETMVILTFDGTVFWSPRAVLSVQCFMEYDYFPFDTQACAVIFTSKVYNGNKVCIKLQDLITLYYNAFKDRLLWFEVDFRHCEWELDIIHTK